VKAYWLPVHSYKNFNGFSLPYEGDAIWNYPEGKFIYGRFKLKDVQYNITGLP
jgi:hypothetical protein